MHGHIPYIVTLEKGVDYDQFWAEMETKIHAHPYVPDRPVEINFDQPMLDRNCIYELTPDEATLLRNDPRVVNVEDPAYAVAKKALIQPDTNFGKVITVNPSGNYANWGLIRTNSITNSYGTGEAAPTGYTYTLDGTGVDIIIADSGLEKDHPEFQNSNGVSRVVDVDMYTYSPALSKPAGWSSNIADLDGHGTHCGGIAAGKTFGWAKNANIYCIKAGNGISNDSANAVSVASGNLTSLILGFHANKPANPVTGQRNPTVVNMSFGFIQTITGVTGGNYRGGNWTGTALRPDLGMLGAMPVSANQRLSFIDSYIDQLTDAGIHVCIAAGNSGYKADVIGGPDYNNTWRSLSVTYFYHQGHSPWAVNAINVGNMSDLVWNATTDQKTTSSVNGPGVDIYAPGNRIVSAVSQTNLYGSYPYYGNSSYKQQALSGTSMAAPQVAGVAALHLQLNPKLTPPQLKATLLADAKPTLYTTGLDNDYTNQRSVCSTVTPKVLYNKYNAGEDNMASGTSMTFRGLS